MKVNFRSSDLGRNLTGFLSELCITKKMFSHNISRADLTENLTCSTIQYLPDLRRRLAGLHLKYSATTHRRHGGGLCVENGRRCRARPGSPPETVVLPPYLSSL
ncbi:hypothetical protein Hanom_Chr00s166226g01826911 [Helianthus anomalus]